MPADTKRSSRSATPADGDSVPFYPDHVRTEAWVAGGLVLASLIICVIGLLSPVGLGEPADPMNTPAHVKPEWYFLALYQVLKYVSKTAGVLIPIVALILLTLWPFIDRMVGHTGPPSSEGALDPMAAKLRRSRLVRIGIVSFSLIVLIGLTVLAEVS
jgi:quinol-cytochrome oxidoreductase complex cytochrome b subunit